MLTIVIERIFIVILIAVTIAFGAINFYCGKKIQEHSQKDQYDQALKYSQIRTLSFSGLFGSGAYTAISIINFWDGAHIYMCIIHGLIVLFLIMALIIAYGVLKK